MSDEKKVLLKQLQLSGIGIIVFIFGCIEKEKAYIIIGICITIFAILRVLLIKKLMKQGNEE